MPKDRKSHPGREARQAHLIVKACSISIKRPTQQKAADYPRSLKLNVVHVSEPEPPEGETPVSWTLLSNLPISTEEEIAYIIDAYRSRWLIEEYFKALKTGCKYETRQMETLDALLVVLGLLAPIAWKLLEMRFMARYAPDRPASEVFSSQHLQILAALRPKKSNITSASTAREAFMAVAKLGGFLNQMVSLDGWS